MRSLPETSMNTDFIPFHRASIGEEEISAVERVLRSGWLTTGPVGLEFEKNFAAYIGCKHAIAVNSCTSALQLALDAISLKPGEEVLLPTYTFTATSEVVTFFGAKPVLCDSEANGFNIDPRDVEQRVTPRTRAIIGVHIAGQPCDLNSLRSVADRHSLHLIEDAAHALPARYDGRRIGTISPLTAFSFYATKTITTAEGGMLTTDNDQYAARIRRMRLHGISGDAWKRYSREGSWFYEIEDAGYKLNLPDVLATIGLEQLKKSDRFHDLRLKLAHLYRERLGKFEELEMPPDTEHASDHAWHLFILRIRPETLIIGRRDFIQELNRAGIGTSVHFIPLHLHPFFNHKYGYTAGDFPNSEYAYSRAISLPLYPDLSESDLDRIITAISDTLSRCRRKIWAGAA